LVILLYCTDGKIAHLPRVHVAARLCRCVNQVEGESSTMVVTERKRETNKKKERKKLTLQIPSSGHFERFVGSTHGS